MTQVSHSSELSLLTVIVVVKQPTVSQLAQDVSKNDTKSLL